MLPACQCLRNPQSTWQAGSIPHLTFEFTDKALNVSSILNYRAIMWRSILLGKLGISILASFVVGGICVTRPRRVELDFAESSRWTGLGIFFLILGVAQIAVIYLLTKKPK